MAHYLNYIEKGGFTSEVRTRIVSEASSVIDGEGEKG